MATSHVFSFTEQIGLTAEHPKSQKLNQKMATGPAKREFAKVLIEDPDEGDYGSARN